MSHTILVAEDDRHIHEVVTEYAKDAGYRALSAHTGTAAAQWLEKGEAIDLFILDIMLPGVSGLALLTQIRQDERYQDKPVIMLTALSDEYTQLASFDSYADDYVTKPFSPKILMKRAAALLRRTGADTGLWQAGEVLVNTQSYEAFEGGEKLPLTLREFELLKSLIRGKGRVLSRQQLLNAVWGYDFFGDERIVDVHIKNVRKKLKTNIIVTVKGVGYKIEPGGFAQ